ncbi:MAG TPA: hypothetical protein VID75_04685, partial [Acidimicrobiales bacterium]
MDVEKATQDVEAFRQALQKYDEVSGTYNPFSMTGGGIDPEVLEARLEQARRPITSNIAYIEDIGRETGLPDIDRLRKWNLNVGSSDAR